MKKLLPLLFSIFALPLFGATLTPIQLLNPLGSSSGQAIVSTGSTSAPAWGGIGVNGIASIAANTVLANATASAASPTAFAMPSCGVSGSALGWTSNSGFTCGSGYAMTAGAVFSGAITPSSTLGIVGTTTNNNANAGSVGEYVTSNASTGSLTSGTNVNVTSISLTAGDWDVSGIVAYSPSGSTLSNQQAGVSTTSATFGAFGTTATLFTSSTGGSGVVTPVVRLSLASTTNVYLIGQAGFSGGSVTATGLIRARRVR